MPVQTRSERFASTVHAEFPEVTGREVNWKYTPVDRLRELLDGELDGSPYAVLYPEAAGTAVEWVDRGHELQVRIVSDRLADGRSHLAACSEHSDLDRHGRSVRRLPATPRSRDLAA